MISPKTSIGCLLLVSAYTTVLAQNSWDHGGFLQESGRIYAQTPNPGDTYAEGQAHFQMWGRAPVRKNISVRGVFDLRLDTHRDVDRRQWLDWEERGIRQPAGSVSELYLDARLGRVDLRVGKQQIRWGRADGFSPTDNIIPYDYLETFDDQRLAVPAVKADVYLSRANLEVAWLPHYVPSRLPLLGQRWFPQLPPGAPISLPDRSEPVITRLSYRDLSGPFPARTLGNGQWGVRWNQVLRKGEFSLSYFDGFDDLPFFRAALAPLSETVSNPPQALISLRREYYRVHVAGADFASEIGPVGIRGELAYFDQTDPLNLDHLLFIIGVDKSWGDWSVLAQYAGQRVNGDLADTAIFPDLGLRSTLICRVERTLGPSRAFEIKGALRLLDGDFFLQPLYSVALSNSWRIKVGATVFAGPRDGYLGQFRDNSHLNLQLIYSW